jgi:glycosyltransferase involved in cell wall biosynthesis
MPNRPLKILFNARADAENYNAQSLNAREIALRLDPARFHSTLFFEHEPDARMAKPAIRLVKLPQKRQTIHLLREMLKAYDAILCLDLSPATYLYLHLHRFVRGKTRAILSLEGPRGNLDGVSAAVRKYADYVGRHSDVTIAISDFVAHDAEDFAGIKSDFVLPVGVDTKIFHPPTKRDAEIPTVVFVGHFIERKGPQFVVQAAERFPAARFRLVGSARGAFGEQLERQCKSMPNVSIERPMPHTQLAEMLRQSDVLLHPSRVEGVPKVTLEASATGLPCIVFDDYQTPSVVDGVTGFQVKTPEEMFARLKLLLADRALRQKMGTAAMVHANNFDWDRIAARWAEILEQVVARR